MRDRLVEILKNFADGTYTSNGKIVEGTKVDDIADLIIADGWIRPPCKVGDWIWYVYRHEINKAKVEEISYDASKHGGYSYSFSVYAWDFKNKRQVAYHPINETTKNKSNINGVEGMDFGEDVYVFLTREEAEAKLKEGGQK